MKINVKNNIRFALRTYLHTKEAMDQVMPPNLVLRNQLLQAAIRLYAIEGALAELSPEIIEYVQVKYWSKELESNSLLSSRFNVSESTIKRWDSILLGTIIKHINLIVF